MQPESQLEMVKTTKLILKYFYILDILIFDCHYFLQFPFARILFGTLLTHLILGFGAYECDCR